MGGWTTKLASFHCPLVTQHYPQISLSKLRKLFEGMRLVIVTATFMSSILLHYQLMMKETIFSICFPIKRESIIESMVRKKTQRKEMISLAT